MVLFLRQTISTISRLRMRHLFIIPLFILFDWTRMRIEYCLIMRRDLRNVDIYRIYGMRWRSISFFRAMKERERGEEKGEEEDSSRFFSSSQNEMWWFVCLFSLSGLLFSSSNTIRINQTISLVHPRIYLLHTEHLYPDVSRHSTSTIEQMSLEKNKICRTTFYILWTLIFKSQLSTRIFIID